jgi:hypothetical protein
MKLRFSIRDLLWLTAFVAITCGGAIGALRLIHGNPWRFLPPALMAYSPFFVPFVFAAYAIGRRRLSPWAILAFAAAEALALLASRFAHSLG